MIRAICSVSVIRNYLNVRTKNMGDLFIHMNGSSVTKFQFFSVLKKCFKYLGLQKYNFTPYSFRIGAATEAARLGLNEAVIRKLGRWESK